MVGSTSEWFWLTGKGAQGRAGLGPRLVGSPCEDPWPLCPHPRPQGHMPLWRTMASVFPPLQKGTTCSVSCFKTQNTLLGSPLKLLLLGQLIAAARMRNKSGAPPELTADPRLWLRSAAPTSFLSPCDGSLFQYSQEIGGFPPPQHRLITLQLY